MKIAKLFIIQGFLGVGKTTFSKKLAMQYAAVIFNPDEWVVKLYKKEEYEKDWNFCFGETIKLLWQKTSIELKNGNNVIFDMGFWKKSDREMARNFAKEHDVELIHYYLFAPDDILKERLKLRHGDIADKNIKNFDKLKQNFEEPQQDENAIVINNY